MNLLNEKERENLEKLEAQIRKKLQALPLKDILESTKGYSVDTEGNMIGLNLYGTGIADISLLRTSPRLTHLDLSVNHISDLSPLQSLTNLTQLYLWKNKISDLSPLQSLINLTVLNLNANQISNLSPLESLTNLTVLYLYGNQISDLSPLQSLTHLTNLDVRWNQISELSPLLPLKKLIELDVRYNNITRLPAEWIGHGIKIKWEYGVRDGLFLKGNPLESPPVEIVQQGDAAVRNYFKEIKEQKDTVLLLHSKLLIVGGGAVGKTTLMKKLQDNSFEVIEGKEPTTHGINIIPWDLTCTFANRETHPVTIHFWDFGGQDILYTTHQFFLTKRSLYLFVWEARQEGQETASFEYWLNIVKLLSAGSPVIIVMNKADSRTQFIDEALFRDKFPFIHAFIQVSCLTGKGITELTERIRSCLADMPHLQDRLPKTWMEIRDNLKRLPNPYISRADYLAVCKEKGLDEERAEFLSDYLHDLGVILHFRNEPLLADTVILDPEWATAAVYKIMDTPAIIANKGRFHYDDLKTLWDAKTYPTHKHPQLLRLMEKFELGFPVAGETKIHIVPELLPPEQPELEEKKYREPGCLCCEIHYEFMPRGILSRFITRLYIYIYHDHYWKNGVELELDNTFTLVKSDALARKLTITISGAEKSDLLAIARQHLREIHRSLNMEKDQHYREMIPCRCPSCLEAEKPYLFPYEVLKRFSSKRITYIHCQDSAEQVAIEGLLKGYAPPEAKTDLKELYPELIRAVVRLQGRAKFIRTDEDSRNTFIAEMLSARGFMVKDQARWGSSGTGKKAGVPDILVEIPDGKTVSIIEAFNLTGMDRRVIADHVRRIFEYDVTGQESNYILVYVDTREFGKLWEEYVGFLPGIDVKVEFRGAKEEKEFPYTGIKVVRAAHRRHNRDAAVVHVFINMGVR